MATPKKYIHDRLVLLILTANTFFAILTGVLILLKLDSARTEAYIIQYRPSLGLSRYFRGNNIGILSFVAFSLLVLVFHTILSMRIYPVRRHLAITVLAMGLLLIILSLIISYSLLLLR